jgi:integrase
MVTLSREQAAALLKAAERRPLLRHLVMLGVATGARLGELLALRGQDVDLAAGTVRIGWSRRIVKRRIQMKGPKTEAGYRTVVLGPTACPACSVSSSTARACRRACTSTRCGTARPASSRGHPRQRHRRPARPR